MLSLTVSNLYSVLACRAWYSRGEVDNLSDQSIESIKTKMQDGGNCIHMSKKYTKVQIRREGLSGLKQDGPKRYLGAGQQLWSTFSQKSAVYNAQTTVRSDQKPMEHQLMKAENKIKTNLALKSQFFSWFGEKSF